MSWTPTLYLVAGETVAALGCGGADVAISLKSGETIYARVVRAMVGTVGTTTVLPWGCEQTIRLERDEVRRASIARVTEWAELTRIRQEQRARERSSKP